MKCSECKYHCDRCDELALRSGQHKADDMLSWCCENSIPTLKDGKYIRGCSWSIKGKMPNGVVTKTKIIEVVSYDSLGHKKVTNGETKIIVSCPMFKRG